jgi:hypothetical protein
MIDPSIFLFFIFFMSILKNYKLYYYNNEINGNSNDNDIMV